MKIVDKSQNVEVTFGSLELEDIFKYENNLYMKVSSGEVEESNAYGFSKSRLTRFSLDTKVYYVPSELILHERDWN